MEVTYRSRYPRLARLPVPSRAVLALLVATVLWGTSFIAAKSVLDGISPIMLAFLRFLIAVAVLLPLLWSRGLRPAWGRDAALLGLSGVAFLFVVQNFGIRLAGAADAALIVSGAFPVLTAALAWMMLGERLHRRAMVGILASVAGVALVFFVAIGSIGSSMLGDLLLLASAASAACYTVLGRRAFVEHEVLAVLLGSMIYGLVFLAPEVVVEGAVGGLPGPSVSDIVLLLYLGAGCSGIAYLLWAYSLRQLAATETAVIGNLEVVVGLAAAGVVLHEPLSSSQVAGGMLVTVGAWLATTPARNATPAHAGRPRQPMLPFLTRRSPPGPDLDELPNHAPLRGQCVGGAPNDRTRHPWSVATPFGRLSVRRHCRPARLAKTGSAIAARSTGSLEAFPSRTDR